MKKKNTSPRAESTRKRKLFANVHLDDDKRVVDLLAWLKRSVARTEEEIAEMRRGVPRSEAQRAMRREAMRRGKARDAFCDAAAFAMRWGMPIEAIEGAAERLGRTTSGIDGVLWVAAFDFERRFRRLELGKPTQTPKTGDDL